MRQQLDDWVGLIRILKKSSFSSFEESDLHQQILVNVSRKGYRFPMPVQRAVIPLIMKKKGRCTQERKFTLFSEGFAYKVFLNAPDRCIFP